ncbi:hypothetical protein H4582DRAFT_2028525 [Lactarius indigo]|nr:hypothetical protein H4582DRAFT_2028525 [Lactarius indigo]
MRTTPTSWTARRDPEYSCLNPEPLTDSPELGARRHFHPETLGFSDKPPSSPRRLVPHPEALYVGYTNGEKPEDPRTRGTEPFLQETTATEKQLKTRALSGQRSRTHAKLQEPTVDHDVPNITRSRSRKISLERTRTTDSDGTSIQHKEQASRNDSYRNPEEPTPIPRGHALGRNWRTRLVPRNSGTRSRARGYTLTRQN